MLAAMKPRTRRVLSMLRMLAAAMFVHTSALALILA